METAGGTGGCLRRVERRTVQNQSAHQEESGFTLIELMVAVAIMTIVLVGTMPAIYLGIDTSRNDRNRVVAASVAASEIDLIQNMASSSFSALAALAPTAADADPPGTTNGAITVNNIPYTVTWAVNWQSSPPPGVNCSSAGTEVLQLIVTVKWADMGTTTPVTSQTVLTSPTGQPTEGGILVYVTDDQGDGDSGVTVTVTGLNPSLEGTTDSQGCVYFSDVAAGGPYEITVSKTSYQGLDGENTVSGDVYAYVGAVSEFTPTYSPEASLRIGLSAPPGYTNGPNAACVPPLNLTAEDPQIAPTGFEPLSPGWGSGCSTGTKVIQQIYPFSAGYSLWAGSCADADPEWSGYDPSAARPNPVTAIAGKTTSTTVTVPGIVTVTLSHQSGGGPGGTITATHAADGSCVNGESYSGLQFNKDTFNIALPYGTWQLDAANETATPPTVQISPAAPDQSLTITVP